MLTGLHRIIDEILKYVERRIYLPKPLELREKVD